MSNATLPANQFGSELMQTADLRTGVDIVRQTMGELKAIRTFVKEEMVRDIDFGLIPGTGKKPTLLLSGAQKVAMYFNTYPEYAVQPLELAEGHVEYIVTTKLINRASGKVIGSGIGSCSTMESKYRFRSAKRVCPQCGKEAIIKGKEEYGGGWLCHKKQDGCGAKFRDNDTKIISQQAGQSDNPNIHDVRNTVLKMSKKRSLVDASHGLGCLSELFTQDLDDVYDLSEPPPPPPIPEEVRSIPGRMVTDFEKHVRDLITRANSRWLDRWHDSSTGEVHVGVSDLINEFQYVNHMIKAGTDAGNVDPPVTDPNYRTRQKAAAKLWMEHADWFHAESRAYLTRLAEEATAKIHDEDEAETAFEAAEVGEGVRERHAGKGDAYEPDEALDEALTS